MNKYVKNALIIIFVPSVVAAGYYTYTFIDRRNKSKSLITSLKSILDKMDKEHTENQPVAMNDVLVKEWETELKKLSDDSFKAFYDYFMVTLPNGKDKEKKNWDYQTKNAIDYDKKKAKLDKYTQELTHKTKVMEYFSTLSDKI